MLYINDTINNHFFFESLRTALVTSLTTPTATVYFMSLTANLPRGGYC